MIDGAQRAYPALTDAQGLVLYKEVLIEVLAQLQVELGTEDVNLTDGTREYELTYDPQILSIRAAYYITDASTNTKLSPTSTDQLDRESAVWRYTTDTGTPSRFYIESPTSASLSTQGKIVIGLDPIPDTTTSGGYPKVRIYGTEYEEPSATSDVPQSIPNVRVLIEGIKRNWAMDTDPERYPLWKRTFEDELTKAQSIIASQIEDLDAPRIAGAWMETIRVV